MVNNKKVSAFGGSVERFGKITSHPGLDVSGLYTERPAACDPGYYHPKSIKEIFQVNKDLLVKDPWRYKIELEEWAENLGYRNSKVLERRRYQQSVLGPAWHEVEGPRKCEPACSNVGFGRAPRTSLFTVNKNPPPGTYFKAQPFKAAHGPHSSHPTFEHGDACRFKKASGPSRSLAPNRYNIIDKESIEQKPNKDVSRRGPYDLFTGERSSFGKQTCESTTWPIALKSTLDRYEKSNFGKMNKSNRSTPYRGRNALIDPVLCVRQPDEPGPGSYGGLHEYKFKQNTYGFNSSYDRPRPYQRVVVWPAVGRYSPSSVDCGPPGHGWQCIFESKTGRSSYIPKPMNTF